MTSVVNIMGLMSRLCATLQTSRRGSVSDADVAYMIAQEYAKAGDQGAAVEWFDRCLAINSGYLYAYFHKARVLEAVEDIPAAVTALKIGVQRPLGRRRQGVERTERLP